MELDEIDRRLLALLRDDGRRPASSLAAAPEAEWAGRAVRAITTIEIRGRATANVLRALRGFPEVRALHTTNGRWDVVAEIVAENLQALDQALNRARMLDGVASTETSILLSTQK